MFKKCRSPKLRYDSYMEPAASENNLILWHDRTGQGKYGTPPSTGPYYGCVHFEQYQNKTPRESVAK